MKIKGKVILWQDILVLASFLLYFGTGFLTTFALTSVEGLSEFAANIEANPIAQEAYRQGYNLMLLQWVEIAFIGGFYYIFRWMCLKKQTHDTGYLLLSFYAVFMFIFFLENFINDLPYAIKIFLELAA